MPITKTCKVCSVQFNVPPVRAETALTCSRACKGHLFSQVRRDAWDTKLCPECGESYRCPQHESHRRKFCSDACKALGESKRWASRPRSDSHSVSRHTEGYLLECVPSHPYAVNGYVLQHRLVMEKVLRERGAAPHFMEEFGGALYLRRDIEVHHRNERKDDNSIGNLVACTKPAHRAIHDGRPVASDEAWPLDGLYVADGVVRDVACTCKGCGAAFRRAPSAVARGHETYCSRACYDASFVGSDLPGRIQMQCVACEKPFVARRHRAVKGTAKYCSNKCRLHGLHKAKRESLKVNEGKSLTERN